jgi:hypothetical protein
MARSVPRLPAWAAAGESAGPLSRQPAAQPAGTPQPVVYEDPAYASFFAEYCQGRPEAQRPETRGPTLVAGSGPTVRRRRGATSDLPGMRLT